MPTYCPRDKCAWTSPDGKCHWPTDNCPHKAERNAAQQRLQERRIAIAQAKARARRNKTNGHVVHGVRQKANGRWEASMSVWTQGENQRAEYYYLGTYDTVQEAAAVRHLAELHRKNGDLEQWMESRRAGE